MVEKLSVTIALDGGKEIERQLADIGKAGQQAFLDISKAAEQAGGFKNLKPEEVTQKLQQMGVTGKDALDKISGAVQQATRLESLVGVVQKVETGFANVGAAAVSFVKALGPIAAAAGVAFGAVVKFASDAASAINKADAAAIKAGLSIEKFDTLRAGLEAAGLSANQVASGMSAISAATEKAKLDQIAKDFKTLQEAATRGFGGIGTAEWERLTTAMQGGGAAADAAKKAITDLGGKISENAAKSLPELIAKTGEYKNGVLDVSKGVAAFVEQLRTMPDSANRSSQALAGLDQAGVALVQAFRNGQITADQFRERLGTLTQDQANAANLIEAEWNRLSTSWERLKTTIGGGLLVNVPTNLIATLEAINSLLNPETWSAWGAAARQAFIDIFAPIGELAVKLAGFVASLGGDIWSAFSSAGAAAINTVIGWVDTLIQKFKDAAQWAAGLLGGGGSPGTTTPAPGNARGGLIGGRGTGTSDSNLSWVSRGEHIMPARAVQQPGVLAFLEALRRSGGNLRGLLDGMGHFATGGLVGMPALGTGGIGGMSHVTIQFPGLPAISGLRASSDVVGELQRAAAMAQVRSGGRKPSRYS